MQITDKRENTPIRSPKVIIPEWQLTHQTLSIETTMLMISLGACDEVPPLLCISVSRTFNFSYQNYCTTTSSSRR
eukprot:SAG11_NODE_539_length_8658_cov_8.164973_5_plen_75_part_00